MRRGSLIVVITLLLVSIPRCQSDEGDGEASGGDSRSIKSFVGPSQSWAGKEGSLIHIHRRPSHNTPGLAEKEGWHRKQSNNSSLRSPGQNAAPDNSSLISQDARLQRIPVFDLREFGADQRRLNTEAFRRAVSAVAVGGGGTLVVPKGRWLTGCFNLTSHMTLFLEEGAVIAGSQDPEDWPVIAPLPSYGRGRELPGPRHSSLIHAQDVTDVVITGNNGTIDGQGSVWWGWFHSGSLNHTRGRLVELVGSRDIVIRNVTLRDSPFWTLHPVYCDNVTVTGVTILSPPDAPNVDGIDPDSSTNVHIENCYISTGDDAIAIKSGWDDYGVSCARPSASITVKNVVAHCPVAAGLAIGSEMSGGVHNVSVSGLVVVGARFGLRIKTAVGRGGYVAKVDFRDIRLDNVSVAISIFPFYGEHPDTTFNQTSVPLVQDISFTGISGERVLQAAANLSGLPQSPVKGLRFSDVALDLGAGAQGFVCRNVSGTAVNVTPMPCPELKPSAVRSEDVAPSLPAATRGEEVARFLPPAAHNEDVATL